jgi:hypothetical protein
VLLLSSSANESPFVKTEVNYAFGHRKAVYTLRIENVEPSKALRLYLARHQWTDGFPLPPDKAKIAQMAVSLLGGVKPAVSPDAAVVPTVSAKSSPPEPAAGATQINPTDGAECAFH